MTRISLLNIDAVAQLQQRAVQAGGAGAALSRLTPGQVLRAEVLADLGNGLFSLNIRGSEVVTQSATQLTPGQLLTLQVNTSADGRSNLSVLQAVDGAVADVAGRTELDNIENNQLANTLARQLPRDLAVPGHRLGNQTPPTVRGPQGGRPQLTIGAPPTETPVPGETLPSVEPAETPIDPRLRGLIRDNGPLAKLLAEQPDAAGRVENLLRQLQGRPEGLGRQIEQLAAQIGQSAQDVDEPVQRQQLTNSQDKLLNQLFGADLFDDPPKLAESLTQKFAQFFLGLESKLTSVLPSSFLPPSITGAGKSPGLGTNFIDPSADPAEAGLSDADLADADNAGTSDRSLDRTPANFANPGSLANRIPAPVSRVPGADGRPVDPRTLSVNDSRPVPLNRSADAVGAKVQGDLAREIAGRYSGDAANTPPREVIRGTVGDLRGQLADLRAQLQSITTQPGQTAENIRDVLARIDVVRQVLDMKAQLQDLTNNRAEPSELVQQTIARIAIARQSLPIAEGAVPGVLPEAGRNPATNPNPVDASAVETAVKAANADTDAANSARATADAADRTNESATAEQRTAAVLASTREATGQTFDADLKGQLLGLRSQLVELSAAQPDASGHLQQAIARTDLLIDQVTAQQVRNLDGLNQFMYVELPINPRTGFDEARLHVFYRKPGDGGGGREAINPDRFTVALFLSMTQIGDVMATVTAADQAVSVGFTVQSPKVLELLDRHSDELRSGLVKAGHGGATVTVRHPAPKTDDGSPAPKQDDELWNAFLAAPPVNGSLGRSLNFEA